MAAKTEVKKETVKTEQENKGILSELEIKLRADIADLAHENGELKTKIAELEYEATIQGGVDIEIDPIETTRTALLLALAPQINLPHARSEAQRLLVAVDDIMQVWGIE